MSDHKSDLKIEDRLKELKEMPLRDPQKVSRGRADFLNEAKTYRQAVSISTSWRQKVWTILTHRKDRYAMNALISLIVAGLVILVSGSTVAAAQDDLPNEPLYPVKLMTENVKMALTGEPQEQASLSMAMAQTRVEEMMGLSKENTPIPPQVGERLQAHIHQTLMIAAGMDEASLTQTLSRLGEQLKTQEQIMAHLQEQTSAETVPLLAQIRQMLQNRIQLVNNGLADPQGFRYVMSNQKQYGQDEDATPEPNQQGEPGFHQNGQGGQSTDEPGQGNESNDNPGAGAPEGNPPDSNQGGETPGGNVPDNTQGGSDSGSGGNGGNGGGSGKNK